MFNGSYPLEWTMIKFSPSSRKVLIKDDPNYYRGINILSAIPKLYDMVLSNRFCTDDIGMILQLTKSQYLTVNSNDEAPFNLQNLQNKHVSW